MSDIFLSYASKDRERIRVLANTLETQGWSVFWDRAIPTGRRWHEILGAELDSCGCVVVIWTAASIHSQWVYEEAEEGKRKGALFPIKLDNVLPPLGFRSFQVANLTGWQGEQDYPALLQLTKDIDAHFQSIRQQEAEAARKAEKERQRADAEAARKAEEEAARKAAAERRRTEEEAIRKAEERRLAMEEAARKATEARHLAEAEATRKAEEERLRAEAARKAEEERRRAEAEAAKARQATATNVHPSTDFNADLRKTHYHIKEKLGEGGMATVYLAQHKLLEREVALKVMSPRIATTEAFRQSFIREARTVAQLDHPHIVRIYDGGANGDLFYMAMELLPGGTLKEQLEDGPLLPEAAISILRQVASALSYAHAKGYIHRDIKPANILFRANGDAALGDFGIAKLQGIVSDMTQMGLVAGTPHYMSPEQTAGGNLDHRADLYSLGILLYEMLLGKQPFNGNSPMAIAYQHINTPLPRLPTGLARFQPVIDKLVAKRPEDRFASADALLQALAKLEQPPPPAEKVDPPTLEVTAIHTIPHPAPQTRATEAPPPPPSSTPPRQRNGKHWLVGIALLTSLGVSSGYYVITTQQKAQQAEQTRQQTAAEAAHQQQEQVRNHLDMAKARGDKQRFFDHTAWNEGCRTLLEDMDGPYAGNDSAEWHYRQVLALDPANEVATWELDRLENRKKIEFSDCDRYQRQDQGKGVDEVEGMFKQ